MIGSLFSGIGGIDIAFQQAGFNIAWANEIDKSCHQTYKHNLPETLLIEEDIRVVNPSMLKSIDILTAGFPCQSFSIAGKQRGFADSRGHLFYEIIKFIKFHNPRFVFLENVPNLIEHDNGQTFQEIQRVLTSLNYSIKYSVEMASEYGNIPQIRNRIYIVAFRDQIDYCRFEFPNKIKLTVSIEDILKRNIKKNDIYYYSQEDQFFHKASKIVKRRDSIYRVYHESIKITQNHMCPTLTASMGTSLNQIPLIIDNYGLRKLTLRECLDFQGFPKKYYFPRTLLLKEAYKQVGNSVCIPVIRRIAEKIARCIFTDALP